MTEIKNKKTDKKQISDLYEILLKNGVPENLAKFRLKMYENILNNSINKDELLAELMNVLNDNKTGSYSVGYTLAMARTKMQKSKIK